MKAVDVREVLEKILPEDVLMEAVRRTGLQSRALRGWRITPARARAAWAPSYGILVPN